MSDSREQRLRFIPSRTISIYLAVGSFSVAIVALIYDKVQGSPNNLKWLLWLHGGLFVVGSAALLFYLMRRQLSVLERSETDLLRANSRLHLISECNELLVRSTSESQLVDEICKILTREGKYLSAWIAFPRYDADKSVHFAASSGLELDYLRKSKVSWGDSASREALTGKVIKSWQPLVVDDYDADPNVGYLREKAVELGIGSSATLPLIADNEVLGALTVCAQAKAGFSDEDVRLLRELAADVAYGIKAIRVRAELAKSAEDLCESEARLRAALDNMIEGCLIIGRDYRCVYLNDTAAKHGRHPRKEMLGGRVTEFYPGIEKTELFAVLRKCMEERIAYSLQTDFTFPDGVTTWFELRMHPVREGVFVSSLDITERRKAEAALRDSETRFRELFMGSPSCIAVYEARNDGEEFIFRDLNPSAERIEGLKKTDVAGKSVLEVFPGVREFGLFDVLKRVWKTGNPEDHPVSLYHDNRITGWKENHVYKLPSGEVVAVYEDVTARKMAENAMQESYAAWDATFNAMRDAMAVLDLDGHIVSCNAAMKTYGKDPGDEMVGVTCCSILHGDNGPIKNCPMRRMTKSLHSEHQDIQRDGRTLRIMTDPVLDSSGSLVRAVHVVHDVTEERAAHKNLRDLSRRLAELEEAERKRLARELHDQVGQLISSIGINLTLASVELEQGDNAESRARVAESQRMLEEAGVRIRNLTSELRPLILDEYGLPAALKCLAKQHRKQTGLAVTLEADEHMKRPSGEVETAFYRIAQEALNNTAKHAHARAASVKVEELPSGGFRMIVADDGTGFDINHAKHRRTDRGLGLLNMSERAEAVAGHLRIDSAPGKGTSVIVEVEGGSLDDKHPAG